MMHLLSRPVSVMLDQELFSREEVSRKGLPPAAIVTSDNYLELQHHWGVVVDLLFQYDERRAIRLSHARVTGNCLDLLFQAHGDVVGSGKMVLYIAREHGNHFFPPLKTAILGAHLRLLLAAHRDEWQRRG